MKALSPKNWLITLMMSMALLLLLITASQAQQQFPAGNATGQFWNKGFMVSDSGLKLPYRLTTSPYWPKQGQIAYNIPDSGVYYNTGNQWVKLTSSIAAGITSLTQGYGLINTPNPITSTGTQKVDTGTLFTALRATIPSLSGYVPYTGATTNVNLGSYNISANNMALGFQAIATSTSTVNLTPTSPNYTLFYGSSTYQTVYLPNTALLTLGTSFQIDNDIAVFGVNVYDYSGTYLITIISGGHTTFTCTSTSIQRWDKVSTFINTISSTTLSLTYSGYGNLDIELNALGVAGTYAYPSSVTTDLYGRVSSITAGTAPGSVTSIATNNGTGITGGTITTSGTLAIDTGGVISTKNYRQKGIDSVNINVGLKYNTADTNQLFRKADSNTHKNPVTLDYANSHYGTGSGSVTSIATTNSTGITGGTITTSGTLALDTIIVGTRLWRQKAVDSLNVIIATKGSGTVTSIATTASTGITGGTITATGTLALDTTIVSTRTWRQKAVDSLNAIIATKGSGSVTSIATTVATGITGGTITTSGTLAIDTTILSTRLWRNKGVDSVAAYVYGSYTPLSTGNSQSGTSYTLLSSDKGKVVSFSSNSAITLTVPTSLGATFYCTIQQNGTGAITPAASGTTLHIAHSYTKSNGQYTMFSIIFTPTTDVYDIQGDMQ